MASTRRMGSIDSEMGVSMLDAAEEILKEQGYAALTSRTIADFLGVKQRLLYYYFRTMDDLILECFKRLSERELDRLQTAISSERPLHEIWDICINTSDARLISEFMALANRNEGIRSEVIFYIEESRRMQIKVLKKLMAQAGFSKDFLPAEVLALIGTSLALAINREAALGVKKGHSAARKTIQEFFERLEP